MSEVRSDFDFGDKTIRNYTTSWSQSVKVLVGTLALFLLMVLLVGNVVLIAFLWSSMNNISSSLSGINEKFNGKFKH